MFAEFADQMRLIRISRGIRQLREVARTRLRERLKHMRKAPDPIVTSRRISHAVMKQIDEMARAQFDLAPHIVDADAGRRARSSACATAG